MAHSPNNLKALLKENSTLVRENLNLKEQIQQLTKKPGAVAVAGKKQTSPKRSKS